MKTLLLALSLLAIAPTLKAEDSPLPDYIYYEGKDTIFCTITHVERLLNQVTMIKYKDASGKEMTIGKSGKKGIKYCTEIKSFRVNGIQSDLVTEDPPKGKRKVHKEVKIKGKITVYSETKLQVTTDEIGVRMIKMFQQFEDAPRTVLLPNDDYYDWYDAEARLKDLLDDCGGTSPGAGADIKEWEEAIKEYNAGCK